MKKTLIITIILISKIVFAVDSGSFDTTFSQDNITDGWDLLSEAGKSYYGTSLVLDSQRRILVAGTYTYGPNNDIGVMVSRYLPSGILDTTFAVSGVYKFPFHPSAPYKIKVLSNRFNNHLFLGYSFINTDNNSDIAIIHIDNMGSSLEIFTFGFDKGSSNDRKDDFFENMMIVQDPFIGSGTIVVIAEVERSEPNDTDFGIAKIRYESDDTLSLDSTFNGNGKTTCFHDHSGFSQDIPISIETTEEHRYLVGGSAFEGNGDDSNGWNLAFCEFSNSGVLLGKFSTKTNTPTVDSREELVDMVIGSVPTGLYLLTLSKEPQQVFSLKNDFIVRKYKYDHLNPGTWDVDTLFSINGMARIGFHDPYLFPASTNDIPSSIFLENSGNILISGTSYWTVNGNQKSYISLAKLTKEGSLHLSWGEQQTGKSNITLDSTTYSDQCSAILESYQTEDIYFTGANFNFSENTISSIIVNLNNDLIFKNNFK